MCIRDRSYRGRFKYHKPVGLGSEERPSDEDIRQIRALYDGSIAAIDASVGELLRDLEKRGLLDSTVIVFTADHGETLFDHGHGQGHGDHLFGDEALHVPLIIRDPRRSGGSRVQTMARDVDIAPTLYALTGISPPSDLDGRSLAPALLGEPLAPAFAFAETELWFTEEIPGLDPELRLPYPGIARLTEIDKRHGDDIVLQKGMVGLTTVARHRMIRDARYKLLYIPTRKGPRYRLFDTELDPDETKDVLAEHPKIAENLRAELWSFMLRDPSMTERSGYLVPKDLTVLAEPSLPGVRLGDAPVEEEPPAGGMP